MFRMKEGTKAVRRSGREKDAVSVNFSATESSLLLELTGVSFYFASFAQLHSALSFPPIRSVIVIVVYPVSFN